MEFGILFLHHLTDEVTRHNLELIRKFNPNALVVTIGADAPLPGGYSLKATPDLEAYHKKDPPRNSHILVCSWFLQKRESCKKWWIVEWDTWCSMPAEEYYKPVWGEKFIGSGISLPTDYPPWYWFKYSQGMPDPWQKKLYGSAPFIYLINEIPLLATCSEMLKYLPLPGNSELIFCTAANFCGYPPKEFNPPSNGITWIPWEHLVKKRWIYHPVKFVAQHENCPTQRLDIFGVTLPTEN